MCGDSPMSTAESGVDSTVWIVQLTIMKDVYMVHHYRTVTALFTWDGDDTPLEQMRGWVMLRKDPIATLDDVLDHTLHSCFCAAWDVKQQQTAPAGVLQ